MADVNLLGAGIWLIFIVLGIRFIFKRFVSVVGMLLFGALYYGSMLTFGVPVTNLALLGVVAVSVVLIGLFSKRRSVHAPSDSTPVQRGPALSREDEFREQQRMEKLARQEREEQEAREQLAFQSWERMRNQ